MYDLLDPELDVLPKLLLEVRDDEVVKSIVGNRVRGKEPQPAALNAAGKDLTPGDVRPVGKWIPFVVMVRLGSPPDPPIPLPRSRLLFRCYGRTDREAARSAERRAGR